MRKKNSNSSKFRDSTDNYLHTYQKRNKSYSIKRVNYQIEKNSLQCALQMILTLILASLL